MTTDKIRIKGEFRDETISLLAAHDIVPEKVTEREDGNITVELRNLSRKKLMEFLNNIPKSYFALQAVIRP